MSIEESLNEDWDVVANESSFDLVSEDLDELVTPTMVGPGEKGKLEAYMLESGGIRNCIVCAAVDRKQGYGYMSHELAESMSLDELRASTEEFFDEIGFVSDFEDLDVYVLGSNTGNSMKQAAVEEAIDGRMSEVEVEPTYDWGEPGDYTSLIIVHEDYSDYDRTVFQTTYSSVDFVDAEDQDFMFS